MPLTGKVSTDVKELLHKYKRTGRIGKVRPSSKEHARRIALAIAYQAEKKKKRGGK